VKPAFDGPVFVNEMSVRGNGSLWHSYSALLIFRPLGGLELEEPDGL